MDVEKGLFVKADLDDYIMLWSFVHGYGRHPEVRLSRRLISDASIVFDVGANVGLWVLGAARRAGPRGKCYAFEPVEAIWEQLRRNLALNNISWVCCEQMALADRIGRVSFYEAPHGNSGTGSLAGATGTGKVAEIDVMTLDRYCRDNSIAQIDFLKLDVEGAELLVFQGAERMLQNSKSPVILFEAHEELAAKFGVDTTAVKSLLEHHGYSIYRCNQDYLEPVRMGEHHFGDDLFALKPCHAARHQCLLRAWSGEGYRTSS